MRDSDQKLQHQLHYMRCADPGAQSSNNSIRQRLLEYMEWLRTSANDIAKLSSDSDLAVTGEDTAYAVEGLIQTVGNYGVLMRWAMEAAQVIQGLPPETAAAFKLDDMVSELKRTVQPGGLMELEHAITETSYIGALCFDSPIFTQMVKTARTKRMREPLVAKQAAAEDVLWKLVEPHRHLGEARLILRENGKGFDDYLEGLASEKEKAAKEKGVPAPPRRDAGEEEDYLRLKINRLLEKAGDRKRRSYTPRRPRRATAI
jgi:hypothetical protein